MSYPEMQLQRKKKAKVDILRTIGLSRYCIDINVSEVDDCMRGPVLY